MLTVSRLLSDSGVVEEVARQLSEVSKYLELPFRVVLTTFSESFHSYFGVLFSHINITTSDFLVEFVHV